MIKQCALCGREFNATVSGQKYCSKECSKEGRRIYIKNWSRKHRGHESGPTRICPVCGHGFKTERNKKYCSPECREEGLKINNRRGWHKYYWRHKEKVKAYHKQYYHKNKEKLRERSKELWLKKKEEGGPYPCSGFKCGQKIPIELCLENCNAESCRFDNDQKMPYLR